MCILALSKPGFAGKKEFRKRHKLKTVTCTWVSGTRCYTAEWMRCHVSVFAFIFDWKLGVWSLGMQLICNALFSLCYDLKMLITVAAQSKGAHTSTSLLASPARRAWPQSRAQINFTTNSWGDTQLYDTHTDESDSAWIIFARSNTGIVGSNLTRGMNVCVRLFSFYVIPYVGSGVATSWSPVQGVLPTVYRLRNWESCQGPMKGCK
jgi:hypothetical protein